MRCPLADGSLARLLVRAAITAAAGVMGAGFLGWRAGLLVAALTALAYVITAVAAPLLGPAWARGRVLRRLRRRGYRLVAAPSGRVLAAGPTGVYLLDARHRRNAVARGDGTWTIGGRPAERVVERHAAAAARAARAVGAEDAVPVLLVSGRLPEPVMRAGGAVLARPKAALRFILDRPVLPDGEERAAAVAAEARRLWSPERREPEARPGPARPEASAPEEESDG